MEKTGRYMCWGTRRPVFLCRFCYLSGGIFDLLGQSGLQLLEKKYNELINSRGVLMKVRIEIDERLQEDEVIIRCSQVDSGIIKLQEAVRDIGSKDWCMTLRMKDTEYYIPLDEILFFETEEKSVWAHTADKMFETSYKLYELEKILPGYFMRISKSTIVNVNGIYSITRNLTASSVVEFTGSAKKVYVSRNYYKVLAERLGERRRRI